MLRIYLDQAKWIDFTKCGRGRSDSQRYQDALDVATEAVRLGQASFVLSSAHYFETHHRAKWLSRLDLATTMARLSKFHTITPPRVVVPAEIDAALVGNGRRMSLNEFGVGFNHAFGTDISLDRLRLPEGVEVPLAVRSQLAEEFRLAMEFAVLANPPFSAEAEQTMLDAARKIQDADKKFANGQTALAGLVDAQNLRGRLGDVATATEIADIIDPLLIGCLRNGIDPLEFVGDRDRIREFLKRVPSRWVTRELRRVRHRNPQQPWVPHDLNDLNALSVAVPYCDVVVTERQWARHIQDLGLADQYGTTVLHDLFELTEVLIGATAAAS